MSDSDAESERENRQCYIVLLEDGDEVHIADTFEDDEQAGRVARSTLKDNPVYDDYTLLERDYYVGR